MFGLLPRIGGPGFGLFLRLPAGSRRYQGMRWIRPKRIKAVAAKESKTAHESRDKRGAVLALLFEFVLLILFLLRKLFALLPR